jgi:hypothetical protein
VGVIVIGGVVPPRSSAPTLLTPTNGSYDDLSGSPVFTWQYNPATVGLAQTGYQFQRIVNSGPVQFWNATSQTWQSTSVWNTSSNQYIDFPSGAWSNGAQVMWTVATADANGQGPPATYFSLIAQAVPTLVVTAPTGTIGTANPLVTWSPSYPHGASQTTYRVVIYNASQYDAVGFAPGSGPSVYDTGVVGSALAKSWDMSLVPLYLPNSTSYQVYVQVAETGGQTSAWAYSSFATDYAAPRACVITAVEGTDPTTECPRITLSVSGRSVPGGYGTGRYGGFAYGGGGFGALGEVVILRSDGLYVRYASILNPASLGVQSPYSLTIYDYEAVPGVQYTYQAQIIVVYGPNESVISLPATSGDVTLTTTAYWELDPTNYASAVSAQIITWNPVVNEQSAAHLVMGQPVPNVVANTMGNLDGSATFWTSNDTVFTGLQALLKSQKTIFVSAPWGANDTAYVRWGPQSGGMSMGTGNRVQDATIQPGSIALNAVRTTNVNFVSQFRPPV